MSKLQHRAFTLIELLVVISIIALLIAILLPALGAARESANIAQGNVNLRSQQQAMVVYSNDNKGYYTGLKSDGTVKSTAEMTGSYGGNTLNARGAQQSGLGVVPRFFVLVQDGILAPEHVFSPVETAPGKAVWTPEVGNSASNLNLSYAILGIFWQSITVRTIGDCIGKKPEAPTGKSWRDDMSSQSPVFSDRNTGINNGDYKSLWNEDKWEGGVVFNDNHTEFLNDRILEKTVLAGTTVEDDDLFDPGHDSANGEVLGHHARMCKWNIRVTYGRNDTDY